MDSQIRELIHRYLTKIKMSFENSFSHNLSTFTETLFIDIHLYRITLL